MAMQPVDLQILFSQLDLVAKEAAAQKEGLTLRGAINAASQEKKTEEKSHSVNELHDGSEELEALSSERYQGSSKRKNDKNPRKYREDKKEEKPVIRDPSLGNYIDLTG
ncbi:MAG: hypothetical protein LBC27_04725 [Spirochaetaceae bacterium]|jgi:hypothetical protein|nr:hypothetical protein [Spirochaetaceae bacterium]